jgi:hypothetical protein
MGHRMVQEPKRRVGAAHGRRIADIHVREAQGRDRDWIVSLVEEGSVGHRLVVESGMKSHHALPAKQLVEGKLKICSEIAGEGVTGRGDFRCI